MLAVLKKHPVALIVLEATGGYERGAALAVQEAGLPLAIVNPRQARDFARALGYLAKTDRIDALALTELARVLHRHPDREKLVKLLPDAEQRQLQALMARRRQLVSMLGSERNRLATSHKVARRSIQAIIKALKRQLEDIEGELARRIAHQHADLAALLSSVKGVGKTTVATLIADVPEANSRGGKSAPSSGLRLWPEIPASFAAGARPLEGAPKSGALSTWRPPLPLGTTPSSSASMTVSSPPERPKRSPLSLACANS